MGRSVGCDNRRRFCFVSFGNLWFGRWALYRSLDCSQFCAACDRGKERSRCSPAGRGTCCSLSQRRPRSPRDFIWGWMSAAGSFAPDGRANRASPVAVIRSALYLLTRLVSAHCGGGFNFEQAFFTRIPVDETELYLAVSRQRRAFPKQI